jgi:hypothetical protein
LRLYSLNPHVFPFLAKNTNINFRYSKEKEMRFCPTNVRKPYSNFQIIMQFFLILFLFFEREIFVGHIAPKSFSRRDFYKIPALKTFPTNRTFPPLKTATFPQTIDCKTVLTYLYIKMVANDGTDAAPRSRAFALGFAGSCRAVLCLQPFFQILL